MILSSLKIEVIQHWSFEGLESQFIKISQGRNQSTTPSTPSPSKNTKTSNPLEKVPAEKSGRMSPFTVVIAITTILSILTAALIQSSRLRGTLAHMAMFFVRPFALGIGWLSVAMLYMPILLYNRVYPFVPHKPSEEETETTKPRRSKRPALSGYQVSQERFNKRFLPVFEDEDNDDHDDAKGERSRKEPPLGEDFMNV
jgi:hypothetical protein